MIGCSSVENFVYIEPDGVTQPSNLTQWEEKQEMLEKRLMDDFIQEGYIISRNEEFEIKDEGDALLWSGLGLSSLSCENAEIIFEEIADSVDYFEGGLVRIDPLPQSYFNDPTSRDMETGAIFGLTNYYRRCGDERVIHVLQKHYRFINDNGFQLFPVGDPTKISITPAFGYYMNLMFSKYLGVLKPSALDKAMYESAVIADSAFIKSSLTACFPVHLGTLQLIQMDFIQENVSKTTKRSFCSITEMMDLPLTDWYCNRLSVADFLDQYDLTQSYRSQRCLKWEEIDSEGHFPALDWLLIYRLASGDLHKAHDIK